MLNLFSHEVRRNPYPMYDQFRSSSPVFNDPNSDTWFVFDYDNVKRILNDLQTFSSRAAPPGGKPLDWLIFSDPPRHIKLRGLVSQAFTPRVVAGLEPRIRDLSRELLDQVIERGEMDLCADYSIPLPLKVIANLIGIPAEDWPRFRSWSDAILRLSDMIWGGEEAAAALSEYREGTADMRGYLQEAVEARRSSPENDLLTRLVQAEVDGERLTEEEILGFFQLLLLAGHETTTNLINNAFLCLIENPATAGRLRESPNLLPGAIEEALRYRSPVQAVFRATRHDIAMGSRLIPAGKLVLAMIGAANRDPNQFPNPERFDITRDPNPHIAFGHGGHFCLGAPLARLESRVALTDLLERLEDFRLASDEPWEPRKAFHVHGPARLPIRFEPRTAGSRMAWTLRQEFGSA